ncbi:Segregation and condensation protein B [Brevundimonas subvibrioides]|uniref:Chromosome segregation and condensation protein, ScpB n=1 Tax=Brevundimonas subvibrioides (strain ATCC 15264 / DSM 4735 / LMG 14903 / NBRC 16000 / CB 81) TaxID=633149 RepID=D9QNQ6_BRESC|nr:SMC-Scp complex subunit ScpB [Brevundimonas subvibrioides]ADL02291.1 chromosome segregation and condensation protein, ScpB [Brevundimonas subvibrioides ATCC 15264]
MSGLTFAPDEAEIERRVEALLFAAVGPLSAADIARRLPEGADAGRAIAALRARYEGRGVELACVADRWAFRTAADLSFLMTEEREEPRRLSKAALETLAIIAYHQPVTRAEIESVRGVSISRGTLDLLLEMGFVRLRGRRRTPGRPVTYATADRFLEHFGLASLYDLPGAAEMKAAGLLDLSLPTGFEVPDPSRSGPDDEDPIEDGDAPEFAQDFVGD